MAVYLIGYDLKKPGQDYKDLFDAIKAVGSDWWHCLDSTWMVVSNGSAVSIRDALRGHIDTSDKLLVVTLTTGAAWSGPFNADCVKWLQKYL
jgi:hypothetical protein